ncbi:hypothetical protein BT96DRAFT_270647 [Gymnopus androsaceus JB14]|uniref:Uncharacterized protein n=1 Tax=Gymnopus androsaceus JB14 TaxID=1447944 RepID=A0A6A4I6H3_9AGAR|nr:hypothetical protein BT96DRAFT_270647 [Gymnopus androsaceus JB14]
MRIFLYHQKSRDPVSFRLPHPHLPCCCLSTTHPPSLLLSFCTNENPTWTFFGLVALVLIRSAHSLSFLCDIVVVARDPSIPYLPYTYFT